MDSSTLRIDEHADLDRKVAGGLRHKVLPKIFSGTDGDADTLCKDLVDIRADGNQRMVIAFAIIDVHGVIRIEVGCMHVAPEIGSLAESTDREMLSHAPNPVLDTKPQRAIAEICLDPVACGVPVILDVPANP
jgi:hypothetical protein